MSNSKPASGCCGPRLANCLDQLRQAQKETVGLNTGAKGIGTAVRVDEKPTLASQGIDKNLAQGGDRG